MYGSNSNSSNSNITNNNRPKVFIPTLNFSSIKNIDAIRAETEQLPRNRLKRPVYENNTIDEDKTVRWLTHRTMIAAQIEKENYDLNIQNNNIIESEMTKFTKQFNKIIPTPRFIQPGDQTGRDSSRENPDLDSNSSSTNYP